MLAATATACGDDSGEPSSSAASQASSALSVAASSAAEAVQSATAAAASRLEKLKNGIDAAHDVKIGSTSTDSRTGLTTAEITATNGTSDAADYAIPVFFRDEDGNVIDAAVVSIKNVGACGTAKAIARSNRKLSGKVKAEVGSTLRT